MDFYIQEDSNSDVLYDILGDLVTQDSVFIGATGPTGLSLTGATGAAGSPITGAMGAAGSPITGATGAAGSPITGAAGISGYLLTMTAATGISAGDVVRTLVSGQIVPYSTADGTATGPLGIAQEAITASSTGDILISGTSSIHSGLATGVSYYVSGTAGALSATVSTYRVGKALSATGIFIDF